MKMILFLSGIVLVSNSFYAEVNCQKQIEEVVNHMGYVPEGMSATIMINSNPLVYDVAVYGGGNCDNNYFFQVTMSDEYCTIKKAEFLHY